MSKYLRDWARRNPCGQERGAAKSSFPESDSISGADMGQKYPDVLHRFTYFRRLRVRKIKDLAPNSYVPNEVLQGPEHWRCVPAFK